MSCGLESPHRNLRCSSEARGAIRLQIWGWSRVLSNREAALWLLVSDRLGLISQIWLSLRVSAVSDRFD